jgi:hypothetical protein
LGVARSHHFVPQFYLRRFSADGRSIAVLHKASGRIIDRAPIRGQCAIDNFYGWHPEAESSLSVLESMSAAVIARVLEAERLPLRGSGDYEAFNLHIALQALRTRAMADSNDVMTDRFVRLMAQGRSELEGIDLEKFNIGNSYPAALPIKIALEAFPALGSLESCLLKVGASNRFVTSDNPVTLYNSALSDVWWQGVTGLDSEGLQIFFPLSDRYCAYLYDPAVYRSPSNTGLRILSQDDFAKIVVLIVLNSGKTLYGRAIDDLKVVERIRELTAPLEDYDRLAFVETEPLRKADGTSSSLMANYRPHPPARFAFRFARIHSKANPQNTRSDRSAAERKSRMSKMANMIESRVVESTVSAPRSMINDNEVRRLLSA